MNSLSGSNNNYIVNKAPWWKQSQVPQSLVQFACQQRLRSDTLNFVEKTLHSLMKREGLSEPIRNRRNGKKPHPNGKCLGPEAHKLILMHSLPTIGSPLPRRLPSWLTRHLPQGNDNFFTQRLLGELKLETVCDNARCPNKPECYARHTATFMILGNVCTRPCGFCAVSKGRPQGPADDEPARVAEAVARLGLHHVVITSVTRDDLPDGGANHFYRCILAVRERSRATIEVLTPDFQGNLQAVDRVLEAQPEVYNHNVETVPRFYRKARGRADYRRSLDVLGHVKKRSAPTITKSGLMLGLGETAEELLEVLADLRAVGCDNLTLGQYLAPTLKHIPVARFLPPEEFDALAVLARKLGFHKVVAGPFVRSSYHAEEMVQAHACGSDLA